MASRILERVTSEVISSFILKFIQAGVEIQTNTSVEGISGNERVLRLLLQMGV